LSAVLNALLFLTALGDHDGLFLNGDFWGAAGWARGAPSAAAARVRGRVRGRVGGRVDVLCAGQTDGGAGRRRPASGSSLVAGDEGQEGEEGVVGFCR